MGLKRELAWLEWKRDAEGVLLQGGVVFVSSRDWEIIDMDWRDYSFVLPRCGVNEGRGNRRHALCVTLQGKTNAGLFSRKGTGEL
jgi:hypothetical protein